MLTRSRLQIEFPQYLGDKYPQHRQSYSPARASSRPLAKWLGRLEVVVFVSGIEPRVVWWQPSFWPKLEWVGEEARASCCGEVADLAGHLAGLYVSDYGLNVEPLSFDALILT